LTNQSNCDRILLDYLVNTLKEHKMPIINTIEPQNAVGELAKLYEQIMAMRGNIGSNAKLLSSSPEILRQQMEFIGYYIKHQTLSMALLASIRIFVSSSADCKFCVDFNTAMLINMMGWSAEQVAAMRENIDEAPFKEKEKIMLKFVVKGVKEPHKISADDMQTLRNLGWSDGDILDGLNHGARMLAIDILFNAFKIEKDF
jgi:alkylhydroperoxidase family enzyme